MDSVQFALALEKFDVTVHQPHPPGYFLYVMFGRLLNYLINDANTTFVFISILFSGLTVIAVYYLGKELFDEKTGVIAAVVALTSPSVWFHGEVALTYIGDAFFSTAVAFLCWKVYKGEHRYIWLSAVILGISGGIRQNAVIFLFPLWLFSVKGAPAKKIILSVGLLGLVCLLWFVPMIIMTGGWDAYRAAVRELWLFHFSYAPAFERDWSSFKVFFSALFDFTIYGIGAGVSILILSAYSITRHGRIKLLNRTMALFFSFWALPSIFFYLFFISGTGNPGHVLIFLPPLFVLVAAAVRYMSDEVGDITKKGYLLPITLTLIIINAFIFFYSSYPVSYKEIKNHDRYLEAMLEEIKSFNPSRTAIFVRPYIYYGYRQIMYYLPEYRVYQVDINIAPTGERRKIFWGMNRETSLTDEIILPNSIDNFITPLMYGDRKKTEGVSGVSIKRLPDTDSYIASGHISLIKDIYRDLSVHTE